MTPFPTQWRTGARPSSLVALLLVAAALPVTPAASQTVRGHLLDAGNDQPVGLGLIVLLTESGDSVASTLTDERGYFSLTSPDPGSFHLQASALGYGDATDGVFELALGAEMTVEFRVSPEPLPMDALLASVNRPVVRHQLIRNGFLQRFQRNVGGHFITPYDIERSPATATEELLQGVPPPLSAQTVSARVLHAETSAPVVGALIQLLDDSGTPVRRALTNSRGLVLLTAVDPGRYRLRVEMIGMETEEIGPFDASPDAPIRREVRLGTRPIGLEGFSVEVDERCRVRPGEGDAAARLWDEARKALTITSLTDEEGVYRYRTMLYERELDRDGDIVRSERQSRREAVMRRPFESRPAGELMENGFVEASGRMDLYFAPDADVLLSDLFLDAHCFRPRRGEERTETAGLVGLAFEPLELRGPRVEISGTLWLDPATSELQWLEYRYENLDPDIRSDELGGRVDFRSTPDGNWIVPRWWIRMPAVARRRHPLTGALRPRLAGFVEAGGMVLEVVGGDPALAESGATGAIEGAVRDSVGRPMEGVRVQVVGLDRQASTDSAGRYRLADLVAGTYQVRFLHPGLEAYGFTPVPLTREVPGGDHVSLDFRMPSRASVLEETCRDRETVGANRADLPPQATDGEGILVGWVRDAATDEPLPGAVVSAGRSRWELVLDPFFLERPNDPAAVIEEPYSFEATADERGFYVLCDLPQNWSLSVVGSHQGVESLPDTLRIELGGILEHDIRIPLERRRRPVTPATRPANGRSAPRRFPPSPAHRGRPDPGTPPGSTGARRWPAP